MTAQKVGSYTYATTTGSLNGGWNEEVGYGLLDVSSAIQMACQDTLLLSNQNIVSDTTITHCQVEIENVSVSNNAKLIINSGTKTTIKHSFYVEEGASVIIQ